MNTIKPATPLPWAYDFSTNPCIYTEYSSTPLAQAKGFDDKTKLADAAYIVAACNAYPKLVQALRDVLKIHAGDKLNVRKDFSKMNHKACAQKLLHELGEAE